MSVLQKLQSDTASSMKAGKTEITSTLRLLQAAIKNEQIKLGRELGAEEEFVVLLREAKQRKDSIHQFSQAHRSDLVEVEAKELSIIEEYLPHQMNSDEITVVVDRVITSTGANDISKLGSVIGLVKKETGLSADGATIASIVKSKLTR